jgi:ABC-type transport system involved in Fe-S cluster assembly fused permease/ATPase subunit
VFEVAVSQSTVLQLYLPLYDLGALYRTLNTTLIDTEKLLQLLSEPIEVQDKPGATDLIVQDGEIDFGAFCGLESRATVSLTTYNARECKLLL